MATTESIRSGNRSIPRQTEGEPSTPVLSIARCNMIVCGSVHPARLSSRRGLIRRIVPI